MSADRPATAASPPRAGDPAVITPDAVGLELPVATVGSRGIAWLLDALAIVGGFFVISIATAVFGGGGFIPDWLGVALLLVLAFVLQFGYPILFELTLRGRTPGKAAMGLRVVTTEGAPIGLRHATIRALLGVFELLGTLGAPAVVTSLVSGRGQRLGDLAAGTMVVRERRIGGTPRAASFVPPAGLEAHAAQLDTSRITPATYATIRDTLRRAPQLPPDARLRITNQLATVVAAKVTPDPPPGVPAEPWLWCVAAAVQARRAPAAWGRLPGTAGAPGAGAPGAGAPGAGAPGAGAPYGAGPPDAAGSAPVASDALPPRSTIPPPAAGPDSSAPRPHPSGFAPPD